MADVEQLRAVQRAIADLSDRVIDARAAYGDIPAVRRLVNDVERFRIDVCELESAAPISVPQPAANRISIEDTPHDPAMWTDSDDEGVGGYHGPQVTAVSGARGGAFGTHR